MEQGQADIEEKGRYYIEYNAENSQLVFQGQQINLHNYTRQYVHYRCFFTYEQGILVLYNEDKIYNIYSSDINFNMLFGNYRASSTLQSRQPGLYSSGNLAPVNKNLHSFWAEGETGPGLQSRIWMGNFYYPTKDISGYVSEFHIDGFIIFNGAFQKKYYFKNNRVKTLYIFLDDYGIGEIQLEDKREPQFIFLSAFNSSTLWALDCRFIIKDIYQGTQWNDTCLSRIIPFSFQPHGFRQQNQSNY